MSGFVGFSDRGASGGEEKRLAVEVMKDKVRHRGADTDGYFSNENVALGTVGSKTAISEDGRYVLCLDGDICNKKDLCELLKDELGVKVRLENSAEAVLGMLAHFGERALEKLRGSFAFAFYDRENGSLLLARDPLGIKPLYYGEFDDCFMFASEIKALTAHPKFKKEFNTEVLPLYLQFQYVPTEQTAFKGVKRLLPGHILVCGCDGIKTQRYFDLPVFERNRYKAFSFFAERDGTKRTFLPYKRNEAEMSARLDAVLEKAVERNSASDGEVGGFLSGGVDSGLIMSYAKPKKVFTVGFRDDGFDERVYAMKRAEELGAELHCVEIGAKEFFDSVSAVQYHSDEPYANLSAVPLYLLSKEAKKHVSVILSGEGADELFGGYEWYEDSVIGKVYRALPSGVRKTAGKRAMEGRIGDFLRRNAGDAEKEFIGQAKIMSETEAYSLLKAPYKMLKSPLTVTEPLAKNSLGASLLRKKMSLDMQLWLPLDILNKADKMTMSSALSVRAPYLDLSVLSIAESCGQRLLMRGKTSKYLLRKTAERYMDREAASRQKRGFPVPFKRWIREKKYAEMLRIAFSGEICAKFFDSDVLIKKLELHVSGEENNARVLYTVYAFLKWYEVFFEGAEEKSFVLDSIDLSEHKTARDKLFSDTLNASDKATVRNGRL